MKRGLLLWDFQFNYYLFLYKEIEIIMTDLVNFYELLPKDKQMPVKGFKAHYINKNSRILLIGASGTGKSNSIMNFIERSSGEFHKIVICSFSTTDEPLYTYLKKQLPDVELIDKIEDVPAVQDFDEGNKKTSKLIIFDDFINLSKKEMQKLFDYAISSRKFGFTCIFVSQNYTSVPKIISRNCNYIFVFRINDKISIKRIISNHSLTENRTATEIEHIYYNCIKQPLGFLVIDLSTNDASKQFRCGFVDFL